jgi:hypothetical protein
MICAERSVNGKLTRRCFLLWAGASVIGLAHQPQTAGQHRSVPTYEFANGRWFNGVTFEPKNFYSLGGVLRSRKPASVDQVIDLAGRYVVPPFGDAHNHSLSGPFNLDRMNREYLADGIFYVKNPANIQRDTNLIRDKLNKPETVDAVFANGPLAASGGHPLELYDPGALLSKVKKPGPDGGFENLAYYVVDNERDLQKKWPQIVADRPDFIKTELLYSEQFEQRRNDASYRGYKGLDPRLLRLIVMKAHENRLLVSCHIETATDFRNAVAAGVDEIAHMPGYYPDFSARAQLSWFLITDKDASMAARKRIHVVTTTYVSQAELKQPHELEQARDIQAHNLRVLHNGGVKIAIGPDVYGVTALAEAMNLHSLRVFDNLTLLKMWCETTPRVIFPTRKIGYLREGYECSFLVLSGNPLHGFANVRRIEMRIKQGEILSM